MPILVMSMHDADLYADRVLRAKVMWKHIVFIGGHVIYPDPRGTANVSTLMAHVLQGPLTAFLLTCAWPTDGRSTLAWRCIAARMLALGPLVLVLICIDVPVVLVGELWQLAPGSRLSAALRPG